MELLSPVHTGQKRMELKRRLPVWKKEHYADGVSEWVEGTTPPGTGLDGSTHALPLADEGLA